MKTCVLASLIAALLLVSGCNIQFATPAFPVDTGEDDTISGDASVDGVTPDVPGPDGVEPPDLAGQVCQDLEGGICVSEDDAFEKNHLGCPWGFQPYAVDGCDVLALNACFESAFERVRTCSRPALIVAQTERLCDHTTADDATRYQTQQSRQRAALRDPIALLQQQLTQAGHWNPQDQSRLTETIAEEMDILLNTYLSWRACPADPERIMRHLYAQLPAAYAAQNAMLCTPEEAL